MTNQFAMISPATKLIYEWQKFRLAIQSVDQIIVGVAVIVKGVAIT